MNFREEQNNFWTTAVRSEFVKRCDNNPAYSLRAFSNFLEIDQSLLSKVLNGQRNVTASFIDKASKKLGLSPFHNSKGGDYSFVEKEKFTVLDHWYYFAILELFKTKDFFPDPKFIAQRLEIHAQEAQSSLETLNSLGFLDFESGAYILSRENNSWLNKNGLCEKKQALQKKLSEKALNSIEQIDISLRDNSSLTVAVDKSKIPQIKNKITELRRELDSYISEICKENENCDEVYQTVISFFPLTKLEKNKNKKTREAT